MKSLNKHCSGCLKGRLYKTIALLGYFSLLDDNLLDDKLSEHNESTFLAFLYGY